MELTRKRIFYGWWVTIGCSLVVFGVAGGQFSFGVFMRPMTEEFDWSRGTLSAAFGVTYLISGLLRPWQVILPTVTAPNGWLCRRPDYGLDAGRNFLRNRHSGNCMCCLPS